MKRHAPAAARNSAPIAEVLATELPARGLVLEIASGTGEHAVFFARRFTGLDWQPSDPDAGARASVDAHAAQAGLTNLRPALEIDATDCHWPLAEAAAVLCINMVHISPWSATQGLFANAAKLLAEGSPLILYGPYLEADVATAPSNTAFDRDLRSRHPDWGLRHIEEMDRLGERQGFARTARHSMPANNLMLVFRRQGRTRK